MSVSLGFNEANFMRHNILKAVKGTMKRNDRWASMHS